MKRLVLFLLLLGLGACTGVSYLWQGAVGQMELLSRARPIAELIEDGETAASLRNQLRLAREIREFASSALTLPDNGTYSRYSDLGRPYVLWNVFATPEFSFRPQETCYPIAGCVAYRGYFEETRARTEAEELRRRGLDVFVGGVPAYSTLGWFDDPLPSTVIHYGELELARLIFHELAHQVVYVKDDTAFNESFAVAVEEEGLARWVAQGGKEGLRERVQRGDKYRAGFRGLLRETRRKLEAVYASPLPEAEKRRVKSDIFSDLQSNYRAMRESWGGFSGYDAWFAREQNNASLLSVGLYADKVPQFKALLARCQGEMSAFFDAVRSLGKLGRVERGELLASPGARCG